VNAELHIPTTLLLGKEPLIGGCLGPSGHGEEEEEEEDCVHKHQFHGLGCLVCSTSRSNSKDSFLIIFKTIKIFT